MESRGRKAKGFRAEDMTTSYAKQTTDWAPSFLVARAKRKAELFKSGCRKLGASLALK